LLEKAKQSFVQNHIKHKKTKVGWLRVVQEQPNVSLVWLITCLLSVHI